MPDKTRTEAILELLKRLGDHQTIDPYGVAEELHVKPKAIKDYLSQIERFFGEKLITTKQGPRLTYKLASLPDALHALLAPTGAEELGYLIKVLQESNPKDFEQLSREQKKALDDVAHAHDEIFLFRGTPFEEHPHPEHLTFLKRAIKNREYIALTYGNSAKPRRHYPAAKPLKILFMEGNWYLALINLEEKTDFVRMSFIDTVGYAKGKDTFQYADIHPHLQYLKTFQNAMTLYGVEPQTALIEAAPSIAPYFREGMKPFLSSQHFIKEQYSGAVRFSLEYTQPLEILPFIKRWLPHLMILSPDSLRDQFAQELQDALKAHDS